MKIVSNTSPLIFLAKLGKLKFLSAHTVYIPQQVIDEIRRGKETGHPDYAIIHELIAGLKVHVIDSPVLPHLPENLGVGESAAISLAVRRDIKTIIIDEARARKVARIYQLHPIGTLGIILDQLKRKHISKAECKKLVFSLIGVGYRISEDVLVALLKQLE